MESGKIYHYDMGFAINGNPIPDPQKFSGESSQLDTLGERDVTGELHRNLVATKRHPQMTYENIDWFMVHAIGQFMQDREYFEFTYPDPFSEDGTVTILAYSADFKWDLVRAPTGGGWIGNLKFNVIEK